MSHSLRYGWTHIVKASDYEQHMAAVGQAEANAYLVRDLVMARGLPSGSRLLFPGCGPGQMFDFVSGGFLNPFSVTFTDINPEFVAMKGMRAKNAGLTGFVSVLDDAEAPAVQGPFDLAVLVLLLEHVSWRKCLTALASLPVREFLIIIQTNPEGLSSNVSPHRILPASLAQAVGGESPHLIKEAELTEHLDRLDFELKAREVRSVLDGKAMTGFWFSQ